MSYFSRLTDIVTCNLSELLAGESDRIAVLGQVIREMEEGLAGATRSVKAAAAAEQRLAGELAEQESQVGYWSTQAKQHLRAGDEGQARLALVRKREVEDVIAGLAQQKKAAVATREHLSTTLRALEARLAEARRRLQSAETGAAEMSEAVFLSGAAAIEGSLGRHSARDQEIDAELAALKRELGR